MSIPSDTKASNLARRCQLSVAVPCYNEEECIPELHRRVSQACQGVVGDDYELVLVNDGSSDRTWPLIVELAQRDPRVVGISLSRNHGHQLALTAGLSLCVGDRILVLDADLQDPPELLPQMMQSMDRGADVVYGQRNARVGETWFKRTSAALFYRLIDGMVDIEFPTDTGDFRLMSRRILDLLNTMPEQYRYVRGMVSWLGFKQVPIAYERHERYSGETKYPLRKMILFAVDAVTSFSIRPLKFASVMGLLFGALGLLGIVYALASWMLGAPAPGWASVIITLLILGSTQLIVFGIFGEYLGRLYMESKRRPTFVIDQIVCHVNESSGPDGPERVTEAADRDA